MSTKRAATKGNSSVLCPASLPYLLHQLTAYRPAAADLHACTVLPAGIAGAVVLPVAGVVGGAVQVGRGIANQSEAIREKKAGKIWNKVCCNCTHTRAACALCAAIKQCQVVQLAQLSKQAAAELVWHARLDLVQLTAHKATGYH